MKRSAIIPAAFVLFAFTGCSTIRQYHLAPGNKVETPPTTSYVVDIGTAVFPVTEQPDPCTAGTGPCEATTTTVAVPSNDPLCDTSGFPNPCQAPATVPSEPAEGVCTDGSSNTSGCPRS